MRKIVEQVSTRKSNTFAIAKSIFVFVLIFVIDIFGSLPSSL